MESAVPETAMLDFGAILGRFPLVISGKVKVLVNHVDAVARDSLKALDEETRGLKRTVVRRLKPRGHPAKPLSPRADVIVCLIRVIIALAESIRPHTVWIGIEIVDYDDALSH